MNQLVESTFIDNPDGGMEETSQLIDSEETEPGGQTTTYTVDAALQKIGLGIFQLNVFNFSGTVWFVHAGVALHSALLSPSWQCEFQLSNAELATITVMYPLGNLMGSWVYGILADKYGRKKIIALANVLLLFIGLLSAFAPSYFWLIVLRLIIGVLTISGNQVTTYCVEFMPIRFRSPAVMLLNEYWTVGICFLILLSYLIIPSLGWRYLVFVSVLPIAVILIYYWLVPVSPLYLVSKGRVRKAESVLRLGAKINRRTLPEGDLIAAAPNPDSNQNQTDDDTISPQSVPPPRAVTRLCRCDTKGLLLMIGRKYRFTTLILSVIWFTSAFIYYGAVLMTQDIFIYDTHCPIDLLNSSSHSRNDFCNPLTTPDYMEYLVTTLAEVPGILISILLLEIVGRKITFFLEFMISGGAFFLLFICTGHDRLIKTIILFVIRACISAVFLVTFLYTNEVYPTSIRATSLALLSTVARLAVILASFVSQVLLRESFVSAIGIFGSLGILTALVSLVLPYETKGKIIK